MLEGESAPLIAKVIQKYRLECEGGEIGLHTTFVNKPDKDLVLDQVGQKELRRRRTLLNLNTGAQLGSECCFILTFLKCL